MTTYRHPNNFISNMEKRDKPALLQAAKVTKTKVYIEDKAFDYHGRRLADCVAVFTADKGQDCTPMWQKFNNFKAGRFE